jgi:valyl-tRNA synthetase
MVDFEIGGRHTLEVIQVIDERGKMNENAGEYNGMKAEEARGKIIEKLKEEGLLEKEEEYNHRVAICYRCEHVIEPIPSLQWFLKMNDLAKNALDAVNRKVKLFPTTEKKYFDWLEKPVTGLFCVRFVGTACQFGFAKSTK